MTVRTALSQIIGDQADEGVRDEFRVGREDALPAE